MALFRHPCSRLFPRPAAAALLLMEQRINRVLRHMAPSSPSTRWNLCAEPPPRHVVIVGATGVVGRAAVEQFCQAGWACTMVSRRPPAYPAPDNAVHLPLDLTDRDVCQAALSQLVDVTHLIYTALAGVNISDPAEIATNTDMLRNALLPLESMPSLAHVSILQGRKAYAAYDPDEMLWPLKESQPRQETPSWYWTQEDLLKERRTAAADPHWTWTIWRPPTVLGFVPGAPLSMITAIGVFAAVSRELGKPLRFPGGPPLVKQLVDSRVLARALMWATTEAEAGVGAAADQTFNVANGDVFLWEACFPAIAHCFEGLSIGEPRPSTLADDMPQHAEMWAQMACKYGLQEPDMARLVGNSWSFTDVNLQGLEGLTTAAARDSALAKRNAALGDATETESSASPGLIIAGQLMSMAKLQESGFNNGCDTEEAVVGWIKQMQAEGFLPR